MITKESLAKLLYTAYCAAVGGVAFNGDPLPDWEAFSRDETKQKQKEAWITTAETAMRYGYNPIPNFKHDLGKKVQDKVTGLSGIITNRSECLYGCNRYLIQPKAGDDQKVPDSWWVDEDQIDIVGDGVTVKKKNTGGPMSKKS